MHCALFFSTYLYSSSCQSRLRNRHVHHNSRHKHLSNLISQPQILAIHGSRKNPLPPSLQCRSKIVIPILNSPTTRTLTTTLLALTSQTSLPRNSEPLNPKPPPYWMSPQPNHFSDRLLKRVNIEPVTSNPNPNSLTKDA